MLPRKLKNFNLFIDGVGFAGRVPEITLPKLTRKMDDYRGGGMNAPVSIDMGMDKLEAEFSLAEYNPVVLRQFGMADSQAIVLRFKGAALADDAGGQSDAIEVVMRGRWQEIERGAAKPGDNSDMKVKVAIAYYKELLNGEALIEIDVIGMKEIVGGVDRLAQQRAALGI
ncbi:phage major tail tube protein [Methylocaldum sp. MU1018]